MREDPSLPDWLTGLTREEARDGTLRPQEARARDLQDRLSRPQAARDLSWLDEVVGNTADHPDSSVNPATSPPRAFARAPQPRVTRETALRGRKTRVSSPPAAQPARAGTSRPQDTAPPVTTRVSSPPPAAGAGSNMLERFAFRRLPAWWQSLTERRQRTGTPPPAWLRE